MHAVMELGHQVAGQRMNNITSGCKRTFLSQI